MYVYLLVMYICAYACAIDILMSFVLCYLFNCILSCKLKSVSAKGLDILLQIRTRLYIDLRM